MSFIEFIGFIMTMAAMVAILAKKSWEERDRQKNPEKYRKRENRREQDLKKMLKSLDIDIEEDEEPAPPPKLKLAIKPLEKRKLQEKRFIKEQKFEHDPYAIVFRYKRCRGAAIIQGLRSKKEMMILHEILSKPKALR